MNKDELDQNIALLGIYFNEFTYRDSLLWSQAYKLFYVGLVLIFLPIILIFKVKKLSITTNA